MGENSAISWTDHTWNPWIGCTKVSPACDHCYAERERATTMLGVRWGHGQPRHRTSDDNWKKPLAWNRKAAKEGIRYRVFCASLADVFDAEVPDEWRLDLFRMIVQTPHLDWLLLTKRAKVAREFLSGFAMAPRKSGFLTHNGDTPKGWGGTGEIIHGGGQEQVWPLPNLWLGTTVENQKMADLRIPDLLATPAAVRFLSMEPLLGPVDLASIALPTSWPRCECRDHAPTLNSLDATIYCMGCCEGAEAMNIPTLDWVIVGGESGPSARPMHPDWARSLRDQCAAAGVAFHFKQWGEWAPTDVLGHDTPEAMRLRADVLDGRTDRTHHFEDGAQMGRIGKKAAGRELDGRTHDEYPEARL